jgi:predicted  nucleic acid-binding Zn-ribbon protein
MDKKLEHEKARIDALIDELSELMDRVCELQREIGDRLREFSFTAPLEGQEGSAATEELQAKAKRAIQKIFRLVKGGDPLGPV